MHVEAKAVPGRWTGIQGRMGVVSVSGPPKSNHAGSYIISLYHARRASSVKLYALRTGRHGGQREQRLTRPSVKRIEKNDKFA